jgi:putative ABC transport system permease protein
MFKNYLKIAVRNLMKNASFSLINIVGLSIGIACCIIIFYYFLYEYSFDKFHKNIDNVNYLYGTIDLGFAQIQDPPQASISADLKNDFPEIKQIARIKKDNIILKKDDFSIKLSGISTEPSFLQIFSFPMLVGDKEVALQNKNSIILTKKTARYLFGNDDPMHRTVDLKIGDEFQIFEVSGILNDIPGNSSLQFDFLINLSAIYENEINEGKTAFFTFVLLDDKFSKTQVISRFPETIDKKLIEPFQQYNPKGHFELLSLVDYHMNDDTPLLILSSKGSIQFQLILSGIALLILFIACFNYTNLSVGTISTRIKEVSMRKVLGAARREILLQFLSESLIICLFSLVVGLALAEVTLPVFNSVIGEQLKIDLTMNSLPIIFLLMITIFISFGAGIYPAFLVSRFSSVELFQGKAKLSGKNILSKILITLQFAIAIFLIIGTIFLNRQNKYLLSKELGFDTNKIVRIDAENISENPEVNRSFFNNFKESLAKYSQISQVSGAANSLTDGWFYLFGLKNLSDQKEIGFHLNYVDKDYSELLDLKFREGGNFPFSTENDNSVIVNQAFIKETGIADPIGKNFADCFETSSLDNLKIIGVVQDFHYEPLKNKIGPMVIELNKDENYNFIYVKFNGSILETLKILKKEYAEFAPQIPFEFSFLDEQIARQYDKEKKWCSMISLVSLFSIILSCLGLFALTLLIVNKRTKEIGIRKIMGASEKNILLLINREYLGLLIVANLIAWPVVYYCIELYFRNFPYKADINFWVFPLTGLITFIIASITISLNTIKAAYIDPVKVLRYE